MDHWISNASLPHEIALLGTLSERETLCCRVLHGLFKDSK